MKRVLNLLLILCLALTWAGCSREEEILPRFYYLRTGDSIRYGTADGLVASVEVESMESADDLDLLLQQYLQRPIPENFRSPFPKGTYLLSTIAREDMLVIVLSREFSGLDGIRLTLAGACLTATCHELAGYTRIQVRSGEYVYEFDYNDYIFLDDSAGE
jgi:germination protein M